MSNHPTILIADDDAAICTVLEQALSRAGYRVEITDNPNTLLTWAQQGKGDLIITDVVMPQGDGLETLPKLKQARPELPVIVISAQNTLMTAVKATELGAFDYLPKPFDLDHLLECVGKSLAHKTAAKDTELGALNDLGDGLALIGASPAMQEIFKTIARLVTNDLTVMIHGESGTGKELVARALHKLGPRKSKPFVAVNMAAIPKDLVESELFGYEKGAFTGATSRKNGSFSQAEGGTLFLDEIGDMPLDAQTRLLRVLQQGEYTPVGSNEAIQTNVRIICATHRDIADMVDSQQFREDLFYRLNVVPITVPTLRDRLEDIPTLANHFLEKAHRKGLARKQLDASAIASLSEHSWPGNVRELENLMYRLAALCSEATISADAVIQELQLVSKDATQAAVLELVSDQTGSLEQEVFKHLRVYFDSHHNSLPPDGLYDRILELVERPLIEETLRVTSGNQLKAAKILGINRNTLRKKINQLSIDGHRRLLKQA